MTFKKIAMGPIAIVTVVASSAYAGGPDVTLMPTEMMFQKGGYAEVSVARVTPDVTGQIVATKTMYPEYSATTVAVKTDINEKISIGFANYLSAAIQVDYRNTGVLPAYVDLNIISKMLAAKYQVDDNISVLAGLKYSATNDATANVLKNPGGNLAIPSANGTALALQLAYEKPEIALRVSALYQSETKFDLPMTSDYAPHSGQALINGKAGLPQSMTIRFQSGVAKDTLVFGSMHRGDWNNAQIQFETDSDGTSTPSNTLAARSTFTTSTAYTLGVGRKINDEYAVSATYGWEKGSGYDASSLLSTTDGKKSLTLGGKYTNGAISYSAGFSQIKFGDYRYAGAREFHDNSAKVIGLKVGYSF